MRRYIVCKTCNFIYNYSDIIDGSGIIKKCTNLKVPSYANGIRQRCNTPLVIKDTNGNVKPIKKYAYNSIKTTLERFFMRKNFEKKIEHWRTRSTVPGMLFDVFDGRYFNEFRKEGESNPFVSKEGSLMLSLNVDWFTPTKGMNYHVGAIYLVINNLPRTERYKQHNMILVGLMPGPSEPSISEVNHFLRPMVDELIELYDGILVPTFSNPSGKIIRCALMSVNADIPATKKVCGFTWFNSFVPCHKCADSYPAKENQTNQRCFGSNVDDRSWSPRDKHSNYQQALLWKNAETGPERKKIEQQYGVRWSELHRLGYFDVVRCTTVDVLHNLYLGTAKKMVEHWKSASPKFLTAKDLIDMAKESKNLIVPPQFTPLGSKIEANFSGVKGDEYRSWVMAYSAILLKGRLVGQHMVNWMRFVKANHLLSAPSITISEIDEAHDLLNQFVKANVELYGRDFITFNMHMHMHLRETIKDFGPVYSTWLYSFERTNGDIKKIDINFKEGLEFTYMEKFLQKVHMQDYLNMLPYVIKGNSTMMSVLKKIISEEIEEEDEEDEYMMMDIDEGTADFNDDIADQRQNGDFNLLTFLNNAISENVVLTGSEPLPPVAFPSRRIRTVIMNNEHYNCLYDFYRSVYGRYNLIHITNITSATRFSVVVENLIEKFDQINISGQLFRCMESRSERGIHIQAMVRARETEFRIGRILYFFKHNMSFPNMNNVFGKPIVKQHIFAFVQWYQPSTNEFMSFDSHNIEVWRRSFDPTSKLSILPVHQIHTCVAVTKYVDNNILAIPLPRRIVNC